jgi:endoglycosylceramidase
MDIRPTDLRKRREARAGKIGSALAIAVCLLIPGLAGGQTVPPDKGLGLRADGERLTDGWGRQVILRGVNAGGRSKLPPFFPFDPEPDFETALSRYADAIAGLGFNVVRLLVIYEAAEPVRGRYDEDYLHRYDRMVEAMSRRGVRVIVDSHQDLFSRRYCGDGFPDWVLPEADRGRPQHADCKLWSLKYFTPGVAKSFDRLYLNRDQVRDRYVAFFKMLAERYRDQPAVIGFEPMNEPFPGARGMAGYVEWYKKELIPLYEQIGDAVHAVDGRYLIFADLCPLENQGAVFVPRQRPRIQNLVFTPHYYDAGTFGMSLARGGDQWFIRQGLKKHLKLGGAWDAPTLLTEYGISPRFPTAPLYIAKLYAVMDELQLSGTFWEASISRTIWNQENTSLFDPDGTIQPASLCLDRPYPRAVAGRIHDFFFMPNLSRFRLIWIPDPQIAAPTEIYLPRRVFAEKPKIQLEPPGEFAFDPASEILTIPGNGSPAARMVIVTP